MMGIERMSERDADALGAFLNAFDDKDWAFKVFSDFINDAAAHFFKVYIDNAFVGFCGIYHNTMNETHFCKVMDIRVAPGFRRRGVARALMLDALDAAKRLGLDRTKLEVAVGNPAQKLYESLGFRVTDTEKGFYDDGGDAYIMWRRESEGR